MRTNNISQYSAYQTSFQRSIVDRTVPQSIAKTITTAKNIQAIQQEYSIRFGKYNNDEDAFGRPILHLFIKIPKGLKSLVRSLFSLKPNKEVIYEKPYTAHDDTGISDQIRELTIADIESVIAQTQKNDLIVRKATPPSGVER